LISYHVVGQSFRDSFVNNYERELCSNGQYQFVGAFRNNILDYKPFYPGGPDLQISKLAKKAAGKDQNVGELYDISRNIRADRKERRLNVFVICVESLSAEFLTHFGQKKNLTPFIDRWFKEGLFFLMTTSNHRPYTFPEGKIDIPSGTGGRPGAVKYTDYALGAFLSLARKQKWFDDTVFVLVADHCASANGEVGLPLNKYHIPLFIYSPKYIPAREVQKIASQIDIGPTLLSLLGFSYKSYFWGNDILDERFPEAQNESVALILHPYRHLK